MENRRLFFFLYKSVQAELRLLCVNSKFSVINIILKAELKHTKSHHSPHYKEQFWYCFGSLSMKHSISAALKGQITQKGKRVGIKWPRKTTFQKQEPLTNVISQHGLHNNLIHIHNYYVKSTASCMKLSYPGLSWSHWLWEPYYHRASYITCIVWLEWLFGDG